MTRVLVDGGDSSTIAFGFGGLGWSITIQNISILLENLTLNSYTIFSKFFRIDLQEKNEKILHLRKISSVVFDA